MTNGLNKYSIGSHDIDIEGNDGEYLQASSVVKAVCAWFTPVDFRKMDFYKSDIIHNASDSPESEFIGGLVQENLDLCTLASPATYTYINGDNIPPVLLFHGTKDELVPYAQSNTLYEAMMENSLDCELMVQSMDRECLRII